jgi:hypothetical protein
MTHLRRNVIVCLRSSHRQIGWRNGKRKERTRMRGVKGRALSWVIFLLFFFDISFAFVSGFEETIDSAREGHDLELDGRFG